MSKARFRQWNCWMHPAIGSHPEDFPWPLASNSTALKGVPFVFAAATESLITGKLSHDRLCIARGSVGPKPWPHTICRSLGFPMTSHGSTVSSKRHKSSCIVFITFSGINLLKLSQEMTIKQDMQYSAQNCVAFKPSRVFLCLSHLAFSLAQGSENKTFLEYALEEECAARCLVMRVALEHVSPWIH